MYTQGFLTGALSAAAVYAIYTVLVEGSLSGIKQSSNHDAEFHKNDIASGEDILKYGVPNRGPALRYYRNHILAYDQSKRTPVWVAEHLTKEKLHGNADRRKSKFRPDPAVPSMFSSGNGDYLGSGWSRGHMAPAGDNKYDQEAMDDTFYLTNIVPQDMENNAGFWNRFEMFCRDLTKQFTDVRVISGPLALPNLEEDGKKYVKYEVIGDSMVPVPTHLFKVILTENAETDQHSQFLGAFIVPNVPISSEHKLQKFQVPLEDLERVAGVTFFDKLDKGQVQDLCSSDRCQLIPQKHFEMHFIGRRMENAKTVEELENIWNEMKNKKSKPTKDIKNLYEERKEELMPDRMRAELK
ncbi:nuclease EXOG, mitochondrial [Lingula anatina]|uniref:Nuclease EXOG, mitochondrial n=1 Tax=Lingula anatina TaxID=7574 RepID=A0A1S3H2B5_LINAN|nr:nuclease EXOG, mitochondrial [Lingula anatina]XP_013380077.1 nuclease EXOG, mitochondrial [Lingula anatina]XP_013380078.1 nuclease EXOG, mitochondrial [Lingula anatina]XP_013380079.1 nuclease EXOG, mitochondrial [Lingula anatina]XP_013380080.1 nuclease EXOG, mitochondrial [Lingula anatina]XP_013380081.1 nuclease EXOG, mitochondrial [Lingula anatina]XP_013380082.1 nuclease EXOG, mitochondrial [Lingula anatina]|eukprot:XP_013380076.1 nuclease EXOG, mitochondrial [Lingula anatina]